MGFRANRGFCVETEPIDVKNAYGHRLFIFELQVAMGPRRQGVGSGRGGLQYCISVNSVYCLYYGILRSSTLPEPGGLGG